MLALAERSEYNQRFTGDWISSLGSSLGGRPKGEKPTLPRAWIMRATYRVLLWLAAPLLVLRLIWRGRTEPEYRTRWWERFGFVSLPARHALWFHTVSAGEIIAAAPLIQALQRRFPQSNLCVTTTTASGKERVRALLGSIDYCYLPYDYPSAVKRFLETVRPACLILMETELWPNLIDACWRARIPVLLVNARLSSRSCRRYRWLRPMTTRMLRQIKAIACQFDEHRQRFLSLGAAPEAVSIAGTLKFDLDVDLRQREHVSEMRDLLALGERHVWIAGSTHAGEEAIVLAAHELVRKRYPDALLILVPRHAQRAEDVAALLREQPYVRVSEREAVVVECSVLLGDRMGELMTLYGLAQVAFVGGSLVDHGGHNLIEPFWHGCPVVSGPSVRNFEAVARHFERSGALRTVTDAQTLADAVIELLADPAERARRAAIAGEVIQQHRGAKERLLELIAAEAVG